MDSNKPKQDFTSLVADFEEAAGRETKPERPQIGVLAIQGDYERHAAALEESGAQPSLIKTPNALESLDALILPGGESTTMLKFLERAGFFDALKTFAQQKPVFGTCAGAILLAKEVRSPSQVSLGILDIAVERNAYGAQRDSAILTLDTKLPGGPLETVFIRAPRIVSILNAASPEVEILAERDGFPVLVRQGRTMAATFHPELSTDRRVHRLFVDAVISSKN
jgi:5'-phosphate synthase pdxT subunit